MTFVRRVVALRVAVEGSPICHCSQIQLKSKAIFLLKSTTANSTLVFSIKIHFRWDNSMLFRFFDQKRCLENSLPTAAITKDGFAALKHEERIPVNCVPGIPPKTARTVHYFENLMAIWSIE
jgi:hypothetical protein